MADTGKGAVGNCRDVSVVAVMVGICGFPEASDTGKGVAGSCRDALVVACEVSNIPWYSLMQMPLSGSLGEPPPRLTWSKH